MKSCKKHRYNITNVAYLDFPLPNGRPSGRKRGYEFRECRVCGYKPPGRWQKYHGKEDAAPGGEERNNGVTGAGGVP